MSRHCHSRLGCLVTTRELSDGIAKGCLTGRARTKFISTVAATVFYHKSYPTKDEYTHVAQQIIKNHPFMNSGRGSGHVSQLLCSYITYCGCVDLVD